MPYLLHNTGSRTDRATQDGLTGLGFLVAK